MNLLNYDPAILEALACFEALRRLGFLPGEIYFVVPVMPNISFRVELQTQGKHWRYDAGLVESLDGFLIRWDEACEQWNGKAPDAVRKQVYQNSYAVRQAINLLVSLTNAGITWKLKKRKKDAESSLRH